MQEFFLLQGLCVSGASLCVEIILCSGSMSVQQPRSDLLHMATASRSGVTLGTLAAESNSTSQSSVALSQQTFFVCCVCVCMCVRIVCSGWLQTTLPGKRSLYTPHHHHHRPEPSQSCPKAHPTSHSKTKRRFIFPSNRSPL